MSNHAELLDYWLGRCYAADNLLEARLFEVMPMFKKKLAKGSQLEIEARNRVPKLEQVKERCFISKKHLQYLHQALEVS